MSASRVLSAIIALSVCGGCPPSDTAAESDGPIVIGDESLGFRITFPAYTEQLENLVALPGAVYQAFMEDALGELYMVGILDINALGASAGGGSARYDGVIRTATGDLLLLATTSSEGGSQAVAIGLLSNGNLLAVFADVDNSFRSSLFASIELLDVDGTAIDSVMAEGSPTLLNPPLEGVAVLSDGTAFGAVDQAEIFKIAEWRPGDFVDHGSADGFPGGGVDREFLTRIGEYRSALVKYLGRHSTLEVSEVIDDAASGRLVRLTNGELWAVHPSDVERASTLSFGERVSFVSRPGTTAIGSIFLVTHAEGRVVKLLAQ